MLTLNQEKKMKIPEEAPNSFIYASFVTRLKAFALDYLIILAYIVVMTGINFGVILRGRALEDISPLFASPVVKDAMAFLTLILPVILYFTLQESSPRQGTWGKRKIGIRVIDAHGDTLKKAQAFVRSLVKFLPWQIAHTSIYQIKEVVPGGPSEPFDITGFVLVYVLVGVYIASAWISKKHRTPYDWASGAYVVVETK
jgi:uncharacterized RDD family membrane protein YckC